MRPAAIRPPAAPAIHPFVGYGVWTVATSVSLARAREGVQLDQAHCRVRQVHAHPKMRSLIPFDAEPHLSDLVTVTLRGSSLVLLSEPRDADWGETV